MHACDACMHVMRVCMRALQIGPPICMRVMRVMQVVLYVMQVMYVGDARDVCMQVMQVMRVMQVVLYVMQVMYVGDAREYVHMHVM